MLVENPPTSSFCYFYEKKEDIDDFPVKLILQNQLKENRYV